MKPEKMHLCGECGRHFGVIEATAEPQTAEVENGIRIKVAAKLANASFCPFCGAQLQSGRVEYAYAEVPR